MTTYQEFCNVDPKRFFLQSASALLSTPMIILQVVKALLALLPPVLLVKASSEEHFENWHMSLDVGGPVTKIFRPQNNVTDITPHVQSQDFAGGLHALLDILAQVEVGKRIRAYGSKWSMSNTAYVSDYLIEPWALTFCIVGIEKEDHVTLEYQPKMDRLTFAQGGIMIKHLGEFLVEQGYSLSAMGGLDGQRLSGLISTGTHGSSPHYGATQEFVRGIHLVISKNEHVFIQRASNPVVTSQFTNEYLFGARLIEDDDLFNAAVVSIGSFGIIHAFLIEVEPLFTVSVRYKAMNYDDVKDVMSSMDVAKLGFDGITDVPWALYFIVNPYNLQQVHVGAYEKILPGQSSAVSMTSIGYIKAADVQAANDPMDMVVQSGQLNFIDRWFSVLPTSVTNYFKKIIYSRVVKAVMDYYASLALIHSGQPMSKIYTLMGSDRQTQRSPIPTTEIEISVPVEFVTDVVDIWIEITQRRPIMQSINVRYVKGSNATLAFTRFDMSATISMFGYWSNSIARDAEDIYLEVFSAMASTSIPHCWHWGKKQPPTSEWVVNHCLGLEAKNIWIEQRRALLKTSETLYMFSNDNLISLGLYSP